MMNDRLIICDSNIPWHHNRYSKHHFMSRLARCNDVVFVNPQVEAHEFVRARGYSGLRLGARLERPEGEDLTVFTPLALPWRGEAALLKKADQRYFARQLKQVIARHQGHDLVLFIGNPCNVFLLDAFPTAACTVYHCSDNFPALFRARMRAEVERCEAVLVRRVDLVVCSHPDLVTKCTDLGGKANYLPHGVDESILGVVERGLSCPHDLADLPRPIIGFVGSLDRGVDFALLKAVAQAHPGRNFVFVGPVDDDCTEWAAGLGGLSNCRLVGPKPWSEIASYLAQFSVALVPFVVNEFNLARYPLKLLEYLGAGLSVVSTAMRLDEQLLKYVMVAEGSAEFATRLGEALALVGDHNHRARQVELIREQYTWDRRAQQLGDMIEAAMCQSDETYASC